ncbi:hypothetical protein [Bosea sp. BIWAKO-01]|uniref:hypothetical protein n=1 Tax=Bosea sp. BIWAKO-01 TaxID=506668 RepID=UPI00114D0FEF|nr:hypothetical protein [Bosea sp. BIWAKO-01]
MATNITGAGTLVATLFLLASSAGPVLAKPNQRSAILGWWIWNESGISAAEPRERQQSEPSFAFNFRENGVLDSFVHMPSGLGRGSGEALGSEGRYRLTHGRLVITRDRESADGWPSRNDNPPLRYSCRFELAPDAASFVLANCPISGAWVRNVRE